MFSQIPYMDVPQHPGNYYTFGTYTPPNAVPIPPNTNPPVMAELIAKRIVAKRPFLCRMDFEDFVASLLPCSPNDPPDLTPPAVIPDIHYPLGAIYYAIQKRISGTAGLNGEISLSQFMEIPGLPENDYPDGKVNPYKGSNSPASMATRFKFFVGENTTGGTYCPPRTQCTLTVKAFNNFLNSVSTSPGPAFKATVLMQTGVQGAPNAIVMNFNANDAYSPAQVRLGGDDVYDPVNHCINAGPNGICESAVFGYSYYSHDYGGKVPNEYKPARLINQPNP